MTLRMVIIFVSVFPVVHGGGGRKVGLASVASTQCFKKNPDRRRLVQIGHGKHELYFVGISVP